MDTSFYTAVRGAMTQQAHMDILSNNIANVNTNGYKTKTGSFLDLMYFNMQDRRETDTRIKSGDGSAGTEDRHGFYRRHVHQHWR